MKKNLAVPESVAALPLTGYIQRQPMTVTTTQRALARIRDEMKTKKLTQTDLAVFSGISQSKLSKIFHGVRQLDVEDLTRIAQGVGLSLTEVVRDHGLEFCAEMTPTELRFLERLRQLPQPDQDAIMRLLAVASKTRPQSRSALPPKKVNPRLG